MEEVEEKVLREGPIRTCSDLRIYRQAYRLALDIFAVSKGFQGKSNMSWAGRFGVRRDQ
ncbi:MAG TPA: hypothetical protein VJS43_09330 [Candidatus Acidoferrales bacterium]|nr:hypothetical protein [Candidatus Acidoferrales bacterium]